MSTDPLFAEVSNGRISCEDVVKGRKCTKGLTSKRPRGGIFDLNEAPKRVGHPHIGQCGGVSTSPPVKPFGVPPANVTVREAELAARTCVACCKSVPYIIFLPCRKLFNMAMMTINPRCQPAVVVNSQHINFVRHRRSKIKKENIRATTKKTGHSSSQQTPPLPPLPLLCLYKVLRSNTTHSNNQREQ